MGVIGAGFLHIITPFFFVFPGVLAYKILGPNLKPADSASDIDAGAIRLLRVYLETGLAHGELSRRYGELDESTHLLYFFLFDVE